MNRLRGAVVTSCLVLLIGSAGLGARQADDVWIDPEPPDAQARAEAVVDAEFNQNKRQPIAGRSTTLVARVLSIEGVRKSIAGRSTALVARVLSIEGVRSLIEASATSLEDRLADLNAEITDTEVKIRLSGSVLFDFNSTDIRPDAEPALTAVLKVLKAYADNHVRIEGHTDSIDAESYNQALSKRRAASVRDWLVAHGADGSLMQTRGFGESQPVADNDTPEGRQMNRRVELVIETGG